MGVEINVDKSTVKVFKVELEGRRPTYIEQDCREDGLTI